MNILNRDWLLAIPIFFIFSCNPGSKQKNFTYSTFAALDSFEVVMPAEYLQTTYWTTYKEGSKTILVEYGLHNMGELIIHQVDFDKESYIKTIKISREGPDGFNAAGASIFMKNEDSLYLFPMGRSSFFLYDSNGKKVNEFQYNSSSYERYYLKGYYSSAILLNKDFILPAVNNTRYDDRDYFNKVYPILFFDLKSSSFVDKLEYPGFIKGKMLPSALTGPMIAPMDNENFLINYSFSDSIFIYNIQTKLTTSLYCGADYFGKPKLLNVVPSQLEELPYKIMEVDYGLAFYHNSKIYRIVNHVTPEDYNRLSPGEVLQQNRRRVSLVELNPNTGYLKYYEMPLAKYFVFQDNFLFAGGISIREEGNETFRKFYKYLLE